MPNAGRTESQHKPVCDGSGSSLTRVVSDLVGHCSRVSPFRVRKRAGSRISISHSNIHDAHHGRA